MRRATGTLPGPPSSSSLCLLLLVLVLFFCFRPVSQFERMRRSKILLDGHGRNVAIFLRRIRASVSVTRYTSVRNKYKRKVKKEAGTASSGLNTKKKKQRRRPIVQTEIEMKNSRKIKMVCNDIASSAGDTPPPHPPLAMFQRPPTGPATHT